MTEGQKIVLLNGSPKGRGGSSGSFGDYILGKISQKGITKETYHVGKFLRKDENWNSLVQSVNNADTIILSFPLYWDSLPSHLIKGLERLHIQKTESQKVQNFYTIVNNGFPEPWHNEIAIDICRCFAKKMNYIWQGALNIGGGAAVAGRPLENTGGMTFKLRETLDLAAEVIGQGKPIPSEVKERLSKPLCPPWINIVFGGMRWRHQARKKGAKTPIRSKPYEK